MEKYKKQNLKKTTKKLDQILQSGLRQDDINNNCVHMQQQLRDYMERQSTEALDIILQYVVNNYTYAPEKVVQTILEILEEREKEIPLEITPEIWAAVSRYEEKVKQLREQVNV